MSQDTQIPVSQPWTFKSDLVKMIPGYFLCFKFPKLLFCAFRYRNDWKSPPSVCQSDGTGDSLGLGKTLKESRCCFLSPEISVRTWANAEKVQACWGPQVRTHTERGRSPRKESRPRDCILSKVPAMLAKPLRTGRSSLPPGKYPSLRCQLCHKGQNNGTKESCLISQSQQLGN